MLVVIFLMMYVILYNNDTVLLTSRWHTRFMYIMYLESVVMENNSYLCEQ